MRCGNTRKCPHCQWLAVQELVRLVLLDALTDPPSGILTLTTRDPDDHGATFVRSTEQVMKALRRRWPRLEYLGQVEFTTGRGSRSGGRRRMHMHVLLKGVPLDDLPAAEALARAVWSRRLNAHRVQLEPLRSIDATVHYVLEHYAKPEQAPPAWWSGKRTRPSRGYYSRPIAELRALARQELAEERALRAARAALGEFASADEVELAAEIASQDAPPRLVRVIERASGVLVPLGPLERDSAPRDAQAGQHGEYRP